MKRLIIYCLPADGIVWFVQIKYIFKQQFLLLQFPPICFFGCEGTTVGCYVNKETMLAMHSWININLIYK